MLRHIRSNKIMLQLWRYTLRPMSGKIKHQMHLFTVILAMLPAVVSAFTIDGFSSGMSREEVAAVARSRMLDAWDIGSGNMAIGRPTESQIDGTFAFCEGRLFVYSRNIDFDVDFYQSIQSLSSQYGQAVKLESLQQPWSGPSGGVIKSVRIVWQQEADKIELSVVPEGRDGKGALRYHRNASVSYISRNKCSAKHVEKQ